MTESIIIGIVTVVVLGIGSQWLAWQIRVPSILLLLVVGFLAGPVLRVLPPETLQGDWVLAFVSLSIGIILFEGGLNLRRSELREVGAPVLRLITTGVLATWILAGLAAYFLLGFSPAMSVQLGAILTVTGPTVVIPLLRHVRPRGRVGAVAKWEGITIDPVGAILAVLVLETLLVVNQSVSAGGDVGVLELVMNAVQGLFLIVIVSVGISVTTAAVLILMLYRRMVPDYLQSPMALMFVVGSFGLSNVLQAESGLLQVTIFGIIMANQHWVTLRKITEFKENLQVLLIACLFIVLSARLELDALDYIDYGTLAFLVVLIAIVRPASVFLATARTRLNLREKSFLSWLAPRGIVAAAVASLFAYNLQDIYPDEAAHLVPVVFLVIVGTVAVYGLTLAPVARWLKLADSDPQGTVMLGAHAWGRQFAAVLKGLGLEVLLIDTNLFNIEQSKKMGLRAEVANALSESTIDELDLGGMGRFFALTANDEVNSLAALHFSEVFESKSVYQLDARLPEAATFDPRPSSLRGRSLFGEETTFATVSQRFRQGVEIVTIEVGEEEEYEQAVEKFGNEAILMCIVRDGRLLVQAESERLDPEEGDVVLLLPPSPRRETPDDGTAGLVSLVGDAAVLDTLSAPSFEAIVKDVSRRLAEGLPYTADSLEERFLEMARSGAMAVSHGVAFPHCRVRDLEHPVLALARCQEGITIGRADDHFHGVEAGGPVYAFFFLVSPEDHPGRHLRTLANLANRVDEDTFLESWINAPDEHHIRLLIAPEIDDQG